MANRDKDVHFHLLTPDGECRLRQKLYCPETGKEYDFKQAARGLEVAPDQYVLVTDEEIDKIKPERGRRIEILEFVDQKAIDPIYYDRAYYLLPDEGGERPYKLLTQAMEGAGRVAVAHFVMRDKQYLAAIRPREDKLILQTMKYGDEVVQPAELKMAHPHSEAPIQAAEVDVAKQLIAALAGRFDPKRYHDEVRDKIQQLIQTKRRGGDVSQLMAEEPEPPAPINLMEALQKSLRQTGRPTNGKTHRRKSA